MEKAYEIIKMGQGTWRIEEEGVRFFLLTGTQKALLIDSGMMVHEARDIAASLTDLPLTLVNTHGDRDHIGSSSQFPTFFMHPDEEENYRKNGGSGDLLPLTEGEVLDLGERPIKVIHLPGHTPGSIALLDEKRRVLISGDPIQEKGRIFMFGEHRNLSDYIESLEHLKSFQDSFDEIWPSHGALPVSPSRIPLLQEGARRILDGSLTGEPIEVFGHPVTAYDLGFCVLLGEREV